MEVNGRKEELLRKRVLKGIKAERTTMSLGASDADKNFVTVAILFMLTLYISYITILKGK